MLLTFTLLPSVILSNTYALASLYGRVIPCQNTMRMKAHSLYEYSIYIIMRKIENFSQTSNKCKLRGREEKRGLKKRKEKKRKKTGQEKGVGTWAHNNVDWSTLIFTFLHFLMGKGTSKAMA